MTPETITASRRFMPAQEPGSPRNRQKGEARYNAKLNAAKVREIRRNAGTVKNIAQAADHGVCEGTIEHVISRRSWRHVE